MMQEIEDLIETLPKDERLIVTKLRSIILDTDPHLQERLSYGVPYFFHNRRVCYLWPASLVPCGYTKPILEKVTLGLCYGNLLSNAQEILIADKRKQVYVVKYTNMSEIDEQAVREIIQEAVLVDEQFSKQKKIKK